MADNDDMDYNLNADNLEEGIFQKEGTQCPKSTRIILVIFIR